MQYLLDTNVCVMYLNGRSESVRERMIAEPSQNIALCSVVKSELFYGAMRSNNPERTLERQQKFLARFTSLSFDDAAATTFGQVRADLAKAGTPIGPYDLQIAAIALVHDLTLVTHNLREFSRVHGLKLEDWQR